MTLSHVPYGKRQREVEKEMAVTKEIALDEHKVEKPPLGLEPEKYHTARQNYERIKDIVEAIDRYTDASQPCPKVWITELKQRLTHLVAGTGEKDV
jgi:hypothetical protein